MGRVTDFEMTEWESGYIAGMNGEAHYNKSMAFADGWIVGVCAVGLYWVVESEKEGDEFGCVSGSVTEVQAFDWQFDMSEYGH